MSTRQDKTSGDKHLASQRRRKTLHEMQAGQMTTFDMS
jgi:hypothetical protein